MDIRNLGIPSNQLQEFCDRWKVSELAVFGSALRSDFSPASDIDVLISFAEDAHWGLFDLVRMQDELESLFGREVDLVERKAVENSENYIRRRGILEGAEIVYST